MLKFAIGLLVAFGVGAACRFFEIPAPAPPALQGALLVVAVTLGYLSVDRLMTGKVQHAAPAAIVTPRQDPHSNLGGKPPIS